MRTLLFIICIFAFHAATAQKLLKGVVLDDEKGTPLSKASVFLNNTSVGVMANEEGKFELYIPSGRYELIVSSIGYATYNQSITASEITDFITIRLKIKAPELEAVVIEPFEKDGWEKWGRWFNDNFIGTSEYGRDSRIINPEVLKFRHSKSKGLLTVIALAPLIIENKALGYRLTYQLENFAYDFRSHYLLYAGYPFFENMQGGDRKKRGWEKAREDAYYGSMLQFMRAVYRNRILEEGFEIRRLRKVPNAEKQRVRLLYRKEDESDRFVVNSDSSEYYSQILQQDDYKKIIGPAILSGDSIAYGIDSTTAELNFTDFLLVLYKHKTMPSEFMQLFPKSSNQLISEIVLINEKPVQVYANGSYFNPQDLLSNGYWGWWEKIGTLLPVDYKPPRK